MKKFIFSILLTVGLAFAAPANTVAPLPAKVETQEIDCALWAAVIVDILGINVATPFGFNFYQRLVILCEENIN